MISKLKNKSTVIILSTYLIMVAVLTLSIIAVHCIPKSCLKENIVKSSHVLQREGIYMQFFDFSLFQMDNFTDSYMLCLAASADESKPVESAMMNYNYKSNPTNLPYDIEKVANDELDSLELNMYGRYWHGYMVFLRPLLTFLNYNHIRILNYLLFTLLLIGFTVLMFKKSLKVEAIILLISLVAINFFIVPYSMQFSTCFYVAFLGMIAILKWPRLTDNKSYLMVTFFVLGGLTSFFDFLTTPQLTLGLPLIVAILVNKPDKAYKWVIGLSIVWAIGYGMIWVSKWIIAYVLTGNSIMDNAVGAAKVRFSHSYHDNELSISNILSFFWNKVQEKRLSMVFYTGLAFAALLLLSYMRLLKNRASLLKNSWLLLIAGIVPFWYIALRNHSIEHYWFTWRALLLTLYSLLLYIYYTIDFKKLTKK